MCQERSSMLLWRISADFPCARVWCFSLLRSCTPVLSGLVVGGCLLIID